MVLVASSNSNDLICILKSHVVWLHLLAEASARGWGRGRLRFLGAHSGWLGTTRRAAAVQHRQSGCKEEQVRSCAVVRLPSSASSAWQVWLPHCVLHGLLGVEEQQGRAFPRAWVAADPPRLSFPRLKASFKPPAKLSDS